MITVTWTASGLWAWFADNPGAIAAARLKTLIRKAQKQTFQEWLGMKSGQPVGIGLRFSERGFNALALSMRAASYRHHQQKRLGRALPYTSPQGSSLGGASGSMRDAILGGSGTRVTAKNDGQDTVTTQMAITGANVLNMPNPAGTNPLYRRQFLAFDAGGKLDAEWLRNRSNELAWLFIAQDLQKAQRRVLRAQATLQNDAAAGAA
jgi:hypothetical protein